MKKHFTYLLLFSLIILSCNSGYYGHLPRAKTKKTETVKNVTKQELNEITAIIINEDISNTPSAFKSTKEVKPTSIKNKFTAAKKATKKQYAKFKNKAQNIIPNKPRDRTLSGQAISAFIALLLLAAIIYIIVSGVDFGIGCGTIGLFLLVLIFIALVFGGVNLNG